MSIRKGNFGNMYWKQIYWGIIFLLVVLITWQIMDLKVTYQKIAFIRSKGTVDSKDYLTLLQKGAAKQKEYLDYVEKVSLWQPGIDPLSWLTQQADELGLKVTRIEHPPTVKISEYEQVLINITIRGDYNLLGIFINKLERSTNAFRIDSLRMGRKESFPDQTIMALSLSYFRKAGGL